MFSLNVISPLQINMHLQTMNSRRPWFWLCVQIVIELLVHCVWITKNVFIHHRMHCPPIHCFFTDNLPKVLISKLCMNSNQAIDTQCTNCKILIRTWPKLLLGYPSGYPNIGISLKPRFRLRVRIVFWLLVHHVRIAKNVFIHQCTNSHIHNPSSRDVFFNGDHKTLINTADFIREILFVLRELK